MPWYNAAINTLLLLLAILMYLADAKKPSMHYIACESPGWEVTGTQYGCAFRIDLDVTLHKAADIEI